MDILIDVLLPEPWRPTTHRVWENRGWLVLASSVAMLAVAIAAEFSALQILLRLSDPKH